MADIIISDEFLGSNSPERAKMCRKLAAEADALASAAINPETRKAYLDLKRQWDELAGEIALAAKTANGGS